MGQFGPLTLTLQMPLPRYVLSFPARSALKSLHAWCLGSVIFQRETFRNRLGPQGKALLDVCWDLRTRGHCQEDITRLNDNLLLDEHIKCVSDELCDDVLLKLAIFTWHFDASSELPCQELFLFIASPVDKFEDLSSTLGKTYSAHTGGCTSHREFAERFAKLLGFLEFALGNHWNLIWQFMPLRHME